MKVTMFARVDDSVQPYTMLYRQALERQGIVVHSEQEFDLKWLLSKGKSCDAIHLHWVEAAYKPAQLKTQSDLFKKLAHNRLVHSLRGALRLANFAATLGLAKLQGKVVVYTVHNLTPHGQESRFFAFLNRLAQRIILFQSDHIHVHNDYSRQRLATVYKRKRNVHVVPLGNYVGYYPNNVSRSQARRQLGLPDDAFVYLFLGMIRPYKGVEELIDAFEKLDSPTGRLLIVGRVSRDSRKILSRGEDNPAIKLVPEFVPDEALQLYMNACDAFVLPYRKVTTSSAVVLAWSFGRPIIAPSITSFPEFTTSETGILYDPSQPRALVSALQQASQQPWSESKISDYVRQFDWDRLGPQLANLYQAG